MYETRDACFVDEGWLDVRGEQYPVSVLATGETVILLDREEYGADLELSAPVGRLV